jgi:hypothetical protein
MTMYREPLDDEIESCTPETEDQRLLRNAQCRIRVSHRARLLESVAEARCCYAAAIVKEFSEIDPDLQKHAKRLQFSWAAELKLLRDRLSTEYHQMKTWGQEQVDNAEAEGATIRATLAIQDNNRAVEMGR